MLYLRFNWERRWVNASLALARWWLGGGVRHSRLGFNATGRNWTQQGTFQKFFAGKQLHVWMTSHEIIAMVGTDHLLSPDPLQSAWLCASLGC